MSVFTRRTAIIRMAKIKFGTIDFGLINEAKLSFKPMELGRDSYGRTVTSLYDVKIEFNLLANDNNSLKEIFTIARDSGEDILSIYGYGGDIQIPNMLLRFEPEINLDGKASKIKVTLDRYISENDAISLWLITATVGPPIVTNIVDGLNPPASTFLV